MSIIPQIIRDAFNESAKVHKRVVVVGTQGSSKTTSLGCLSLTCDIKTMNDPKFSAYIEEKTSGILQVPSDLCQGKFPDATLAGYFYEANMVMTWKTRFGKKTVVLPFCETAGEDMEKLIGPYSKSIYQRNPKYKESQILVNHICNSSGYIVTLPVSRARMFDGKAMEEESKDLLPDPDVNIRRILAAIIGYKRDMKSKPIEGIAVLLTKYDMIMLDAKARGMDLYDHDGAEKFLRTYFRQTCSLLKHYDLLPNVKFFPVHVQAKTIEKSDHTLEFTNEILVDPMRNLPEYSEQSFLDLIEWIRETFAK